MVNLKSYYRKIEKGLGYQPEKQKEVLLNLKGSITLYLEENPEATLEDIHETFGTPEKIIKDNGEYIPEIIVKKTAVYKYWILGIVAVAVLAVGVLMAIALVDGQSANNGHAVVEGGEITTSGTATTITGRST